MSKPWKISIYSDGADLSKMKESYASGLVDGFTTNPSLMKAGGVTDYLSFAKDVLTAFPKVPISFEVFGDDAETMKKEALILKDLGDQVFVKIPIIDTKGNSMAPLIKELSELEIKLNVTAITTTEQVRNAVDAFKVGTTNIVSIFVGRLNDVGMDTDAFVKESRAICDSKPGSLLLWASTREVYNIVQADRLGCDIITVPPQIISKLKNLGKSAEEISLDTVKAFQKDISELDFSILD
ncbi:transaldolase [Enterococcus pallens]|uniref:Transaldolase n=1 Tax=Enterococcus pallens ATCC BAA-351 TaxID=1158607 RepID=R2QGW4_9ENTE|nr:transaldolase [Enterococcus pallens]EOH94428.1 transaldolase [Enterococcus pallens ATCC BAA-351]EOU24307.1 transaldolase [Enterococcus pallens ATCC BAA-351]OJG81911.1 transaldolase [Enterococcus pallens]